jgi:hypothetical protein
VGLLCSILATSDYILGQLFAPAPTLTPTVTPTPTRTSTPTITLTPTATGISFHVVVMGAAGWFNTRITVHSGQILELSASGTAYTDDRPDHIPWNPPGSSGGICKPDCLMPKGPYGALVGKISFGDPFLVGEFLVMTAADDGTLSLGVNDDSIYFFDNSGSYDVRVIIR